MGENLEEKVQREALSPAHSKMLKGGWIACYGLASALGFLILSQRTHPIFCNQTLSDCFLGSLSVLNAYLALETYRKPYRPLSQYL